MKFLDKETGTLGERIRTLFNPINPGLLALELTLGGGVFHPPLHKTRTT